MPFEELTDQLSRATTRRTIVTTGVKLAYAAPLVAATMKLTAGGLSAQTPVSGGGSVQCPECWHDEGGQCVLNAPVDGCACCFTNTGGVCVPDFPVDHDGDGCVCGFYNVGGVCVPNPPQ